MRNLKKLAVCLLGISFSLLSLQVSAATASDSKSGTTVACGSCGKGGKKG